MENINPGKIVFMKRQKNANRSARLKQLFSISFILFSILFFVFLALFRNTLTGYTSQLKQSYMDPQIVKSESVKVDSAYNYIKNKLPYKSTFLEFGAIGCSSCKQMEGVLEEIRTLYPKEINVQFKNVRLKENQTIMEYYGIVVIPTQVLLDREGKEFFRHTGVLTTDEMVKIFNSKLEKK